MSSNTAHISYHDALRLKLNATTSVASASITFFRHWCDRQAEYLPPSVKYEMKGLDFSSLVERWEALKLLQQHGVDIQSVSTYTISKKEGST